MEQTQEQHKQKQHTHKTKHTYTKQTNYKNTNKSSCYTTQKLSVHINKQNIITQTHNTTTQTQTHVFVAQTQHKKHNMKLLFTNIIFAQITQKTKTNTCVCFV